MDIRVYENGAGIMMLAFRTDDGFITIEEMTVKEAALFAQRLRMAVARATKLAGGKGDK
jgi:hypothetical protein